MAINLTTSWQNVANSTWAPGTGFSVTFCLDAKYSSQNQENNNTTIQTRLTSVVNAGRGSGYNYSFSCSYANTVSGSGLWTLENEIITNGEAIITHNNDGTKTLNISANAKITGISMNVSINGDIILPSIARYPVLTSAPDFTDEENPTIYYTTSLGFSGATVYGAIYSANSSTAYASYRPVVVASGSYTFNLTTEERNRLRNASANSNELDVVFYLKTETGQTNYYSSLQRKLRIVNANPTFTYTTTETNNKVISLLGTSANSVVQNASIVTVTTTPTAKKGATIDAVIVSSEGFRNTDTTSPYSVNVPIKSNLIRITVGDSRGNTSETSITKTLIPYQPMSILNLSFERTSPTSSNVLINLEATYYQQTFGSTANVPIVEWKLDNGSYTTIPSTNYTINNTNHKLTITNYELTNILNYQNSGTFTIKISDKLTEAYNSKVVTKGIPTFELGEHDAKVNGNLYLANEDGTHIIKIDGKTYSNDEKVVGKWSDGQLLYEKTVVYTSSLGNGINLIPHGISNFKFVVTAWGQLKGNSTYILGAFESSTKFININYVDRNYIAIAVGSEWANSFPDGCNVTILYAKTTS